MVNKTIDQEERRKPITANTFKTQTPSGPVNKDVKGENGTSKRESGLNSDTTAWQQCSEPDTVAKDVPSLSFAQTYQHQKNVMLMHIGYDMRFQKLFIGWWQDLGEQVERDKWVKQK